MTSTAFWFQLQTRKIDSADGEMAPEKSKRDNYHLERINTEYVLVVDGIVHGGGR